jgi:ABC-type Zn2+ transport system substrate-binding protein/surface adhesin
MASRKLLVVLALRAASTTHNTQHTHNTHHTRKTETQTPTQTQTQTQTHTHTNKTNTHAKLLEVLIPLVASDLRKEDDAATQDQVQGWSSFWML